MELRSEFGSKFLTNSGFFRGPKELALLVGLFVGRDGIVVVCIYISVCVRIGILICDLITLHLFVTFSMLFAELKF